jgi:hypothetical protein
MDCILAQTEKNTHGILLKQNKRRKKCAQGTG